MKETETKCFSLKPETIEKLEKLKHLHINLSSFVDCTLYESADELLTKWRGK